ncbi:Homeobox domain-containing protein/HALZ domain-containing protein/HD-ZIP_N domain-containing protein [Cephalotus follicularis]|uniref:Homeobox domain-containing protein/HALZ domain-containing protein/HD-ZIP_N domain-containing protein n=1 Tax=Cephalotus follicularis TaxID=3775 RepID=A0A1Q3B7F3_CEPFO|nr:Homeobox domain-containing protein/HALZ domain-containing protein/HD-ZIP_N domain-containing protein [Cephalotus follicularis]
MELALSLGDPSKPLSFLEKASKKGSKDLGFCMGLGSVFNGKSHDKGESKHQDETRVSSDPPLQLDLLPFSPVPRGYPSSHVRFPWLIDTLVTEPGSSDKHGKGTESNRLSLVEEAEDGAAISSPNSTVSSFQMDFCMRSGSNCRSKRETEVEIERASDDEENGSTRKKLRLSKEQSAFLEESFKEHNTLNPKQKLALAKQLNLRPRQVEVWFQNRRARTKLKQTEVDCEYLKRCCETLTEENRRLQKELQELRALKISKPFYMQLPATTLTMCPSCERVATNTNNPSSTVTNPIKHMAATTTTTNNNSSSNKSATFC